MAGRKKSTKLFDHEHRFLQEAYLRHGYTVEHYEVLPDELHKLCEEFRAHFGRTDSDEVLLHYMRTKRKMAQWVRFDGQHNAKPALPKLSPEHKEILIAIYYEHVAGLGSGSDNLGYEPETAAMLATEFEHRTMRRVPAPYLIGILTDLRKRGLLPPVQKKDPNAGFDDIDDVAE